ncbi:hypothetical protein LRS74_33105 [Streptomyces sp. LX-29]|uniref:hypothetical protein n=1 Tax=Streptomyces sp. LX-29 TaxID=2900152 RepID=UPI00240D72A8|nr:hypothetical protein [Streptomyces sp. LX-29]WFB11334.1 hypothetical protein LRS74_33105 [Streptomyces sp. LX-29]
MLAAVFSAKCGRRLTAADLGLAEADSEDLTRFRGPTELLTDLTHMTSAALLNGTQTSTTPSPHPGEQARPAIPYEPERLLPALGSV